MRGILKERCCAKLWNRWTPPISIIGVFCFCVAGVCLLWSGQNQVCCLNRSIPACFVARSTLALLCDCSAGASVLSDQVPAWRKKCKIQSQSLSSLAHLGVLAVGLGLLSDRCLHLARHLGRPIRPWNLPGAALALRWRLAYGLGLHCASVAWDSRRLQWQLCALVSFIRCFQLSNPSGAKPQFCWRQKWIENVFVFAGCFLFQSREGMKELVRKLFEYLLIHLNDISRK